MNQGLKLLGAAAFAALLAQPASAAILFQDSFDGEGTPGTSVLNYNSFANWTVTGNVDLVQSGQFGITCNGGAGKCLDMDGTPGPGKITSSVINFDGGQRVWVSVAVSGNQRGPSGDDNVDLRIAFGAPTNVSGLTSFLGSSFGPVLLSGFSAGFSVLWDAPWTIYTASFRPTTAGSFQFVIGTSSADDVGPMIDDVLVTQDRPAPVSEPATLALLGAGLLGLAAGRRRKA